MTSNAKHAGRRTLLQRGLAFVGGGAALAIGARWQRTEPSTAAAAPAALTFYARKGPPAPTAGDGRLVAAGELYDAPGGTAVGAFYANSFCVGAPFEAHPGAATNLQFQVLQLPEGTLFTMSGGDGGGETTLHAIVGGTSRYAGARGSCVEQPAVETDAPGTIKFTVTLA
jgi:hypothetical protein